ncbi:methyl-accepting chemotaxis protein [Oxalobacteraceae bacterium GrIS 1.11]
MKVSDLKIGTRLRLGLAVIIVVLLALIGIAYLNFAKLALANEWNFHTYQVIGKLNGMVASLIDIESGARGFALSGDAASLEQYTIGKENLKSDLEKTLTLTIDNPGQQLRLRKLAQQQHHWLETNIDPLIALRRALSDDKLASMAAAARAGEARSGMTAMRVLLAEINDAEEMLLAQRTKEADTLHTTSIITLIAGGFAAPLLAALLATWLERTITIPLNQAINLATQAAKGDLSARIEVSSKDETGALLNALKDMNRSLTLMTREIDDGVNLLAVSSNDILAGTTQMAVSAQQTASAIAETAVTVEEIKQTLMASSQKAQNVSETAQQAVQVSQSGQGAVAELVDGMREIRAQMELISDTIVRLSEQGQAIGEIINTVNGLSEQSNVLAVNASIEAANAGEHGKGFAVVAQEVKNLAEQSKQATVQVRTILWDVQKASSAAVLATELGSKAVDVGSKQLAGAGEAIRQLADSLVENAHAASQITLAAQQQLIGFDQLRLAMKEIQCSTDQNRLSTRQAEVAAHELYALGQRLKAMLARYTV